MSEERYSKGYACFKPVKPWPWHVKVIPGVCVVGLITNKELCQRERERNEQENKKKEKTTRRKGKQNLRQN